MVFVVQNCGNNTIKKQFTWFWNEQLIVKLIVEKKCNNSLMSSALDPRNRGK